MNEKMGERMNEWLIEWINWLPDRWAPSPGIIYPNSTIPAHGSKKPEKNSAEDDVCSNLYN